MLSPTLCTQLRNITFAWKIAGLFPYSLSKSVVRFSLLWSSVSFLYVFIFKVSIYSLWLLSNLIVITKKLHVIHSCWNCMTGIYVVFRYIFQCHTNKAIISIFKILSDVEKILRNAFFRTKRVNFLMWALWNFSLFLSPILLEVNIPMSIRWQIAVSISYFFNFCSQVTLFLALDVINLVHLYFSALIDCTTNARQNPAVIRLWLEEFVICYNKLCSCSSLAADTFGPVFLYHTTMTLVLFLGTSQLVISHWLQTTVTRDPTLFYVSIVYLMRCVILFVFLLQVIETCESVRSEVIL